MTSERSLARLAALIKAKRREQDIGLREAAEQSGISPSTLSRLERGVGATPDGDTMAKLSKWLKVFVEELLYGEQSNQEEVEERELSTPDVIEVHLRADKNLSPETASALAELVRAAYAQLSREATSKHE